MIKTNNRKYPEFGWRLSAETRHRHPVPVPSLFSSMIFLNDFSSLLMLMVGFVWIQFLFFFLVFSLVFFKSDLFQEILSNNAEIFSAITK